MHPDDAAALALRVAVGALVAPPLPADIVAAALANVSARVLIVIAIVPHYAPPPARALCLPRALQGAA